MFRLFHQHILSHFEARTENVRVIYYSNLDFFDYLDNISCTKSNAILHIRKYLR